MSYQVITKSQIIQRNYWINKIENLSGNFGSDSTFVQTELKNEVKIDGVESIVGHLRLSGAIPESYAHDSTVEKLYSKYTDVVIHKAFLAIGLESFVLTERSGVADVECVAPNYSFVADAKAFRLSRTAKNQKDFKVQAMDDWKHGKPYAMVVCPIYQLPANKSQIYQQSASRSVGISTYSHLAVLVRYAEVSNPENAMELLRQIFVTVESMNPAQEAPAYWQAINRVMLKFDTKIQTLWRDEKIASIESVHVARQEALGFLSLERERMMRLTKEEAIAEVIKASQIDRRIETIKSVSDKGLLNIT